MKTETKIERMEQLIRVMQNLTPHQKRKHFNMREWGEKTDCGTTMCAAGFCASDKWFNRRGLKLTPYFHSLFYNKFELRFRKLENWDALHTFFGFEDAHNFLEYASPKAELIFLNPKSVAEVIKAAKARIKELRQ